MRINAYSAIDQAYKPIKSQGVKQAGAVASYAQDQVSISSAGKDFQVAKKAVSAAPDVREDLVAQMKKKYAGEGTNVDVAAFADELVSRFNRTI